VKNKKNIGLIKVLLSKKQPLLERSKRMYDLEFFQNYFNEDCEKYLRYVIKDENLSTTDVFELASTIGCDEAAYRIIYETDPEFVIQDIKAMFRYDLVDDGERLALDTPDLMNLIRPDYVGNSILGEYSLFEYYFPDVSDRFLESVLTDREKMVLSKKSGIKTFEYDKINEDLINEAKNLLSWSIRDVAEKEYLSIVMKDIGTYFKTNDIKFEESGKGEMLLTINIENFIKEILDDYFNNISEETDLLYECSNFFCFLAYMIEYSDNYDFIYTNDFNDFQPDEKEVETLFHERFEDEIG
jgi:hypothetical protein